MISLKGIRKTRRVDNDDLYILSDQLSHNGTDLINKLPSICADCKSNTKYKIWIEESNGFGSRGAYGVDIVYWIRCSNCSDSFEIHYKDYRKILPILKLNVKRTLGTMDEYDYKRQITKIMEKLYRKL